MSMCCGGTIVKALFHCKPHSSFVEYRQVLGLHPSLWNVVHFPTPRSSYTRFLPILLLPKWFTSRALNYNNEFLFNTELHSSESIIFFCFLASSNSLNRNYPNWITNVQTSAVLSFPVQRQPKYISTGASSPNFSSHSPLLFLLPLQKLIISKLGTKPWLITSTPLFHWLKNFINCWKMEDKVYLASIWAQNFPQPFSLMFYQFLLLAFNYSNGHFCNGGPLLMGNTSRFL